MDILHLVDRLEELFNESRPIWFTHNVIMDEDRGLAIGKAGKNLNRTKMLALREHNIQNIILE